MATFSAAFFAGLVSIASPCSLPLIPGVMAYSTEKNRLAPLAIVMGFALIFTAMGVVSATLGDILFYYIGYIKIFSGILITFMGLILLFDPLESLLLCIFQQIPVYRSQAHSAEEKGLLGGLLLGASMGMVWMPCIGPILASILMVVARQGDTAYGGLLLMAYSLGFSVPLLLAAYLSSTFSGQVRKISRYSHVLRRIAGVILVIVGIYFLSAIGLPASVLSASFP
jgi:cytochrome c-type biogenesis protein